LNSVVLVLKAASLVSRALSAQCRQVARLAERHYGLGERLDDAQDQRREVWRVETVV
jgi:hypothetical protein